jgi:hypothetical protein
MIKRLKGVRAQWRKGFNNHKIRGLIVNSEIKIKIIQLCRYTFTPFYHFTIVPLYHCAIIPLRRCSIFDYFENNKLT